MFKVGYGVSTFLKEAMTKAQVEKILMGLKEGQKVRIQRLSPERVCQVPNRGVPCGKRFIAERPNQQYCSPWCQNRASTQASRAK